MVFEIPSVDFYDGAASGQQRKALSKISPPFVMISYATRNNRPLPFTRWLEQDYDLWWDCGGAPKTFLNGDMAETGDYLTSDEAYIDHVESYIDAEGVGETLYALRDYPTMPDVLDLHGRTVEDHQRMTTERHRSLLDLHEKRDLDATPVATVQGWYVEDYLRHIDQLDDAGILDRVEYVSVGSVCARKDVKMAGNIIVNVRDTLPDRLKLHAFGVKGDVLQYEEVVEAIDSADSNAYDAPQSQGIVDRTPDQSYTYLETMRCYLNWRKALAEVAGTERLSTASIPEQQTLEFAATDGGFK